MSIVTDRDTIFVDELIRENARLAVRVEAERQHRCELEAAMGQLKQENEQLSQQVDQAAEDLSLAAAGLEREKVLASKLDRAIKDLHSVMADGDACAVCKNKCLMGTTDACKPRWKGLDE